MPVKFPSMILSLVRPLATTGPRPQVVEKSGDIAEFGLAMFTLLERQLMKEVRDYTREHGVETVRIIDRYGSQVNLHLKESNGEIQYSLSVSELFKHPAFLLQPSNCRFDPMKHILSESTHIHSHPAVIPLSGEDIVQMLMYDTKKEIATTPNGGYSYMEVPDFAQFLKLGDAPLIEAEVIKLAQKTFARKINLLTEDTLTLERVTPENLKKYNRFLIQTW